MRDVIEMFVNGCRGARRVSRTDYLSRWPVSPATPHEREGIEYSLVTLLSSGQGSETAAATCSHSFSGALTRLFDLDDRAEGARSIVADRRDTPRAPDYLSQRPRAPLNRHRDFCHLGHLTHLITTS
ncbi:hypothetical protein ACJJTC_005635 [Scirpophaga incertulas]